MKPVPFILFLLLLFLFSACSSDENQQTVCRPASMITLTDSIVYDYNSEGRLISLSYFSSLFRNEFWLQFKDEIKYDNQGRISQLIKHQFRLDGIEFILNHYKLRYDADNVSMPVEVSIGGNFSPVVITFTHDSRGRLTEMRSSATFGYQSTHYGYNDDDNVVKSFFISNYASGPDTMFQQNLAFDDHARFFSTVPELEFLNIYIYGHEPGMNNRLKTATDILYKDTVTFDVRYDSKGMVAGIKSSGLILNDARFEKMNYRCK